PAIYPVAILPFQERGRDAAELGPKVTDLLFAQLIVNPNMHLVEREDIKKLFDEQELNLSGLVNPGQATQVGYLTGAKIIVTGSVIVVDDSLYLVAKIIGTETSRVLGASSKGKADDELDGLVEDLAGSHRVDRESAGQKQAPVCLDRRPRASRWPDHARSGSGNGIGVVLQGVRLRSPRFSRGQSRRRRCAVDRRRLQPIRRAARQSDFGEGPA
ncbi:MAG: hypothetical protein HYV60_01230, partial [Planctomycetia bacterium]|nr:hypothetical protein [Planctomycetia bacterium]